MTKFIIALLLALAPAIITSLIEGLGEWSNSRNYKKSKALDAIYSFRLHIGNNIDKPNDSYYFNMSKLTSHQLQMMVMYLNQWSVYINNRIASQKIIQNAIGYDLMLCIWLFPIAIKLNDQRDLKGSFQLVKRYHIIYDLIK